MLFDSESAPVDAHDAASCETWEHGIIGDVRQIANEWSSMASRTGRFFGLTALNL